MTLRLVETEKDEARELTDAEVMAEALPHLRRLSHCESLHPLSRYAAESVAKTIERHVRPGGAA